MTGHPLRLIVIMLLSLAADPGCSSAQTITTIAGTGTAGYSGDGGQATKAEIQSAIGIAVSRHGDVYIAEYANSCIRRISPSGIISTVAGNGKGGGKEEGSNGLLTGPVGVAVASNNDVYISDYGANCIRCLHHSSGIMTTVACGSVSSPSGLAMDKADNLYIADQLSSRVCKLDRKGELTVVGQGLQQPSGVAVDDRGTAYASSWSANVVWKITTKGKVSIIAGTGTAGYSGDGEDAKTAMLNQPYSIALGPDGNLYIVDDANCRIRRLDLRTNSITTIAGAKGRGRSGDGGPARKARINGPAGIAISASGDIYFTDENNQQVRKITGLCAPRTTKNYAEQDADYDDLQ